MRERREFTRESERRTSIGGTPQCRVSGEVTLGKAVIRSRAGTL